MFKNQAENNLPGSTIRKSNNILGDKIFRVVLTACAAIILLVVVAMIAVMTQSSWLSIKEFGFGFLTGQVWDPIKGEFGDVDGLDVARDAARGIRTDARYAAEK